jgi:hypothetical protein
MSASIRRGFEPEAASAMARVTLETVFPSCGNADVIGMTRTFFWLSTPIAASSAIQGIRKLRQPKLH